MMFPPGYTIEVRADCVRCLQTGHEVEVRKLAEVPRAALALATLAWLELRRVTAAVERAERPN